MRTGHEQHDAFDSSDSQRHARPLALRTVACTFDEPLQLERGGRLPAVTVAYETYGQLNARRATTRVLICHALSGDSHVARHDERRRSRLVGHRRRARQGDRHRPLLRHLPEHPGRLPRHDRARTASTPQTGQPLRRRLPADHRRRHRRGPAAAGRPPGHRPAAGRGGRLAGRAHGPDLGRRASRTRGRHGGPGHLPAADQPGPGLRRRRPQRHPPRSRSTTPASTTTRARGRSSAWPSPACWDTSPTSRARR